MSEHGATLIPERENESALSDPNFVPQTRRQMRELERTGSFTAVHPVIVVPTQAVVIDEVDKVVVEPAETIEAVVVAPVVIVEPVVVEPVVVLEAASVVEVVPVAETAVVIEAGPVAEVEPAAETLPSTTASIPTFFTGPLPIPMHEHTPRKTRGRKPKAITASASAPAGRTSITSKVFSALVITVVAGLTAVSILPATAGSPADAASLSASSGELMAAKAAPETQAIDESAVEATTVAPRDEYLAAAPVPEVEDRWAGAIGSYTNNPTGTIQWPFAASVPISSMFGPRVAPCAWCSSNHLGVDFVPGEGYPIQSIGTGVVREIVSDTWGYGYHVIIDYPSLGVSAQYAHMQYGSSSLKVGQEVKAGTRVGLVGHTGTVTAPHLHFEIWINDVPVDPYAWLKAHAN